jgi:type II restriction enzyme
MSEWKGENDYAILVCPFYQYPKSRSQIYGQALDDNITLFSWEYLSILLENNISENEHINISNLWNISNIISNETKNSNKNDCFLDEQNKIIRLYLKLGITEFDDYFNKFKLNIITRGETEIKYWKDKIEEINLYTREQAIKELLVSLKLNEKISSIRKYIDSLKNGR